MEPFVYSFEDFYESVETIREILLDAESAFDEGSYNTALALMRRIQHIAEVTANNL